MATENLDCCGLKCPQPTLKVTVMSTKMKPGDILEVVADCATFEKDVREWCARSKKTLLWCKDEGAGKKRVQIKF
jgi:TusA-related sulfurtransferase